MSKTQISIHLHIPESDLDKIEHVKKTFNDDDVEHLIYPLEEESSASFINLIYLSDKMQDYPIFFIDFDITNMNFTKAQDYINKVMYAIKKETKNILIYPNKQYYLVSKSEKSEKVSFIHNGRHSQLEIDSISDQINSIIAKVKINPSKFRSNYYEELAAKEPDLDMCWKLEGNNNLYQMFHKKEPITDWVKHDKNQDFNDFVSELYKQYKEKLNA